MNKKLLKKSLETMTNQEPKIPTNINHENEPSIHNVDLEKESTLRNSGKTIYNADLNDTK